MLRLQKHLLFVRSASPIFFSLHRFLSTSAATAAASSDHFAVEGYLVNSCGLTPAQVLRAHKYVSHLKSPSQPDSVLAFLAGLGLSKTDIARVVAADSRILNSNVDKTLKLRVADLLSLGLSDAQIPRFVLLTASVFRSFNIRNKLGFWMPFFGSSERFLHMLKSNTYLLTSDLEKVIKPNIALLKECGLTACDIAKLCRPASRLLTSPPERVKTVVARADELGVPRGSGMFRQALLTVSSLGPEKVASKIQFLHKTLGWSEADVLMAMRRLPSLLRCSEERVRRASEFLTTVVGLDKEYISGRPALLMYSLERRLVPRHHVLNVLKEKGLVVGDRKFYTVVTLGDNSFLRKYVHPHKDVLLGLSDARLVACIGKGEAAGRVAQ